MLLALATLVVPWAVGFALGRRRQEGVAAGLVLAMVVAGVLWLGRLGTGDWWWLAAWLGVGAAMGRLLEDAQGLAGTLLGAALGLLVLEGGARALLPVSGYLPDAQEARFFLGDMGVAVGMEPRCQPNRATSARAARRPVVVHLGDSLVYGDGWDAPDAAFPQVLDAMDPARTHWNEGENMRSVDCELLTLWRWEGLEDAVDAVVLHLFAGNDAVGIDEPLVTCGDGPVLRYPPEGGVAPACLEPTLPIAVAKRPLLSPAPFAIRRLSGVSRAARELALRYYQLVRSLRPGLLRDGEEGRPPTATDREHLRRALVAMRDHLDARGIPLAVVLLPDRRGLSDDAFSAAHAETVAFLHEAVGDAGLPWLDATPAFAAWVGSGDPDRWFVAADYEDPHLSAEGHAALAGWLAPRLPGLLGAAEAAHASRTGNRSGDDPVDPR